MTMVGRRDDDSRKTRTEPMARKKEKVAALLSMYCESVAMNPLGPDPFLWARSGGPRQKRKKANVLEDAVRAKDEADGQADAAPHESTHPVAR